MNSLVPAPVSWQPSQFWQVLNGSTALLVLTFIRDGDDGSWSSFALRLGTPEQDVRVLPSTAGQATWVVIPEGCLGSSDTECDQSRGGIFNYNKSTTWIGKGDYSLGLEANLGYNQSESGLYGLDTISLGIDNATNLPSLNEQLVAGFATYDYPMGMFGLGQQPTNLSVYDDGYPSYLKVMKSRGLIPSESWGYTAGAPYRLKGVFGSLTFGGYDLSRFDPSNISFPFAADISRNLVVGLQSITSTSTSFNGSTTSLLPSPALAFIDSTIPWIYLPSEACQAFENELGLEFDPDAGLYLVSDELHNSILSKELSFIFQIGDLTTGGPTVSISLPYASFDLMAKPPFVTNSSRYFPILPAKNTSQITLGRVFLQEAYLITDYEHSNFSVSQCIFEDGMQNNIVTIHSADPPNNSNNTTPNTLDGGGQKLSHGINNITIGVVVGVCVFVVFSLILCAFLGRKRLFALGDREVNEDESPPVSLKQLYDYELEDNKLMGYKELADTGLIELPQSSRSLKQNTQTHSAIIGYYPTVKYSFRGHPRSGALRRNLPSHKGQNSWTRHCNANTLTHSVAGDSPTAIGSSQGSSGSKTTKRDISSDKARSNQTFVRNPPSSSVVGSTGTKIHRAWNPPHPQFCTEFVSSPISISRSLPDLRRPLPPLPLKESTRISQISQYIEMYTRQQDQPVKVHDNPISRRGDQDILGNFF